MKRIEDSKKCEFCNATFSRSDLNGINGSKWQKRKYCSRNCLFKEGLSEDVRKKMSDSEKGIKKGPHSEEWKEKISNIMLGKKRGKYKPLSDDILQRRRDRGKEFSGEKSHSWKGGLTNMNVIIRGSAEYKLWRESVFKRDNYTCIWCGDSKGGNLNADHIKPFSLFPELRFAIDNGRTLCISCHKKTDTWGRKVFNYKSNES